MMATPTLGYPSITTAILALRQQSKSDDEIARLLKMKPCRVRLFARATTDRKPRNPWGRITIDRELARPLEEAAQRRGLLLGQLVARIVETVANDEHGLVNAILDDGIADDG